MSERWAVVDGYERYEVSDLGRVRGPRKMLKMGVHRCGYFQVVLCDGEGGEKSHYVHRLVAQAFVLNPMGWKEVNHKNGLKTDNRASNLEWCSRGHNNRHAYLNGLNTVPDNRGERQGRSKLTEHDVLAIRADWDNGDMLQREIAEKYGVAQTTIGSIVQRRNWKHI